jgi:hypothetical protein
MRFKIKVEMTTATPERYRVLIQVFKVLGIAQVHGTAALITQNVRSAFYKLTNGHDPQFLLGNHSRSFVGSIIGETNRPSKMTLVPSAGVLSLRT